MVLSALAPVYLREEHAVVVQRNISNYELKKKIFVVTTICLNFAFEKLVTGKIFTFHSRSRIIRETIFLEISFRALSTQHLGWNFFFFFFFSHRRLSLFLFFISSSFSFLVFSHRHFCIPERIVMCEVVTVVGSVTET